MKFKKEDLLAALCDDHKDFETVFREIYDQRRWDTSYDWIFLHIPTGKYYNTQYDQGSTEMQDTRPFEYEDDEIECDEVFKAIVAIEQFVTAERLEELRGNKKLIFPALS